jgi:uncharacterized protein (TIGR00730 family)
MDRICVYCGSRSGTEERYREQTVAFGQELVEREIDLVYGGGGVGLMGVLAETVLAGGGEVIGVIPDALQGAERPPGDLTDLVVVDSMHARKERMFELAEGFAALAGGLGTLEELFEMLTWSQLGFHDYPCGVLNVDGYYDGLVDFLDTAVAAGFVPEDNRRLLQIHNDPADLIAAFERQRATARDDRPDA